MGRLLVAAILTASACGVGRTALPPDVASALPHAQYVYVQSQRKDGTWSAPAEIWFHQDGNRICVGTRPTSWRVRRIGWKRPRARIAVGKVDGPSFEATGEVVHDHALEERLMADYAKKYPGRWPQFAPSFTDGFRTGERVVVCYTPR